MSDKTSPGYDFFAPAPPAAPSLAGPSAPPAARPVPPAQGGPPATETRTVSPAALAPDGRYRLPRWANLLFSLVAVGLIGALVAAVAIPAVQRHLLTSQWKHTAVQLPASFGGQARRAVNQPATVSELTGDRFGTAQAALYGRSSAKLVLIVAAKSTAAMTAGEQGRARAQFVQGFAATSNGATLDLTRIDDAGPLGGWYGCGPVSGVTVCVATDAGSMVAVVLGPAIEQPHSVALRARAAAVVRT